MQKTASGFVACALILGGCVQPQYIYREDAAPSSDAASPDASAHDAGHGGPHDASPPDAGPRPDAARVWDTPERCVVAAREGQTGDTCTGPALCSTLDGDHDDDAALCDLTGRLLVWDSEWRPCAANVAAPWTSCEEALAGGATGQSCSGSWRCVEVAEDSCCVEIAACNRPRFGAPLPDDRLQRTRVCTRGCPLTVPAGRPTRTECPPEVWSAGDPEVLVGDACTGDWACFLTREGFGNYIDPTVEAVPVWCDGAVMHYAGVASAPLAAPPGSASDEGTIDATLRLHVLGRRAPRVHTPDPVG